VNWQIQSPFVIDPPSGERTARNAASVPPRNARPFMRSNPLVFQAGFVNQLGVLGFNVPIGTTAVIDRVSLKCHPQFAGIFPQAYWSILVDSTPIAAGAGQIFADFTQVRNTFTYTPPRFQTVQWSITGPANFVITFNVPNANGNSFYLYTVVQGFDYTPIGNPPT
jgi:hypothetical protein